MAIFNAANRPSGPSRMQPVKHTATHSKCIVIGAGHAGLSVARGLKAKGLEPMLLDQNSAVGDSWRQRYERLHLHHVTGAMHLPGVKYPDHVPSDENWQLEVLTDTGESVRFTADQVVLAAGATGITPIVPSIAGSESWAGEILHSKNYFNAEPFADKRVLVVGSGNSAIEILCDLHDNGAHPSVLVRGPNSWVTRKGFAYYHHLLAIGGPILTYVPFAWLLAPLVMRALDFYLMFDVKRRYGDLAELGIETDSTPPLLRMAKTRGTKAPSYVDGTWGDVGVAIFDLVRDGRVPLHKAEIDRLAEGTKTVVFTDGSEAEFDVILLCTGFEPVFSHYATFVDPSIVESIEQNGFEPWTEVKGHRGLWAAVAGQTCTFQGT